MPPDQRYQIPLRLPRDIAGRLKAHADNNRLSLNAAIVQAVEQALGVALESRPEAPAVAKDSHQVPAAPAPAASPGGYFCPVCQERKTSPTLRCTCSNRLPVWKD